MKTPPPEATKTVYPILRQIVSLIPPNIFQVPLEVEPELQPPRGGRARGRLGEAQRRPAPRNVWDGWRVEIGRAQAKAPVFAGFSAFHDVSDGMLMKSQKKSVVVAHEDLTLFCSHPTLRQFQNLYLSSFSESVIILSLLTTMLVTL